MSATIVSYVFPVLMLVRCRNPDCCSSGRIIAEVEPNVSFRVMCPRCKWWTTPQGSYPQKPLTRRQLMRQQ